MGHFGNGVNPLLQGLSHSSPVPAEAAVTFTYSLSTVSLTDISIKSNPPVLQKEVCDRHPPSTSDVLQAFLSHSGDQITLAPLTTHPGGAAYIGLVTAANESFPLAA